MTATGTAWPDAAGTPPRTERGVSLRVAVALGFGGLALALATALGLVFGHAAALALEARIGAELRRTAAHMAERLDRGMSERWRDVRVAAALPLFRDPAVPAAAKRAVLEELRRTFPLYAWLGFADADGTVTAETDGLLEGVGVAGRPWFDEGLTGPFFGDVHKAIPPAKTRPAPAHGEPPRFLDIAAPVLPEGGGPAVGVLAARLSWEWAAEAIRPGAAPDPDGLPAEVLVVARDGAVLLGPPGVVTGAPSPHVGGGVGAGGRAVGGGARLEGDRPGGRRWLVAGAPTLGHGGYPGLGWSVLVRVPADGAFAPVRELRARFLWGGLLTALAFAALGWFASRWIAQPIDALTRAVDRLGVPGGAARAAPEWLAGQVRRRYREATTLATALDALLAALEGHRRELEAGLAERTALLQEVHHRVKNNLQMIVSLLRMDLRRSDDAGARSRLEEAIRRVQVMGFAHRHLDAAASLERVPVHELLRELARDRPLPLAAGGRPVELEVEAEPILCAVEDAIPLGLAANELVTEALGRAGGPHGRVVARLLSTRDGGAELSVAESGVDAARQALGAPGELVRVLARQLGATVRTEVGPEGRRVTLALPVGRTAAGTGPAGGA